MPATACCWALAVVITTDTKCIVGCRYADAAFHLQMCTIRVLFTGTVDDITGHGNGIAVGLISFAESGRQQNTLAI